MLKPMKPVPYNGQWSIEVETEDLGNVLLLKKQESLPIPVVFETEEAALAYITHYQQSHESSGF